MTTSERYRLEALEKTTQAVRNELHTLKALVRTSNLRRECEIAMAVDSALLFVRKAESLLSEPLSRLTTQKAVCAEEATREAV